jgi:hypothetical protein
VLIYVCWQRILQKVSGHHIGWDSVCLFIVSHQIDSELGANRKMLFYGDGRIIIVSSAGWCKSFVMMS